MKEYLIGAGDPDLFKSQMLLAIIGAALFLAIGALRRNKKSPATPEPWSWTFFFADNFIRIFGNLFFIYLAVRFAVQISYFYQIGPSGDLIAKNTDVQLAYAALVGIVSDYLFYWVQKLRRQISNKVREKFVGKGTDPEEDQLP